MNPADASATISQAQLDAILAEPDQLEVRFQPVIGFDTRAVFGAESLLRARLDGVPISPLVMVDAAVRHGRIREIGRHVLEQACRAHNQWRAAGHGRVVMMVNVDATELADPDLVRATESILAKHAMPHERVIMEITETAFIEDRPIVNENLAALRDLGLGLALDDFGAGYASLSHLRSVPLTVVKLDRQFVAQVDGTGIDHEIIRNVIRLSHSLGLRVIAEGVEVESQRRELHALGCDAWQGFLRAPAVSADEFLDQWCTVSTAQTGAADAPIIDPLSDVDSFVLRRIGAHRWAHLGGRNRGEGWAGIVEVDDNQAPIIARAFADGVQRVHHNEQRWLIGPYHPRDAVVVPVDIETMVVFGVTQDDLPDASDAEWVVRATELAAETTTVSPAKRLADELEMSEALQGLIAGAPNTLDEAMRHVVASTARALSCEFGVLYLPADGRIAFDDHMIHHADSAPIIAALDELAASMTGPICVQNAADVPFPLPLPSDFNVRSWIALPTASALGGILVCAHTDRNPRGFTTMCQNLGRKLADAAELVLYAGTERERLQSVASSATIEARMDALTGLLNRRGWDDALDACARVDVPTSVFIADLNELKYVNDTQGHDAGDQLLVAAARCLSTLVRREDVVARIGGDEFAILLRGADPVVCRRLVGQLDTLVEAERIELPGLSIAAGHATNDGATSIGETVALADSRMYAAKARMKRIAVAHSG